MNTPPLGSATWWRRWGPLLVFVLGLACVLAATLIPRAAHWTDFDGHETTALFSLERAFGFGANLLVPLGLLLFVWQWWSGRGNRR